MTAALDEPIPLMVPGVLGPIRVTIVEDLRGDDGAELFGYWDAFARTIAIRAGLAVTMQWATLEHERVHAALFDVGVNDLPDEMEERVCNAIATHRVARP